MTQLLHQLPSHTDSILSPQQFTFPFNYTPHPLCVAAVESIMPECRRLIDPDDGGKMFGVLVVTDETGRRYFLAAFSGIIQGSYTQPGFVPPVYNLQHPSSYFQHEEKEISAINDRINSGEDTAELRTERKLRSQALQQWLFTQFNMLNAHGESHHLIDIFSDQPVILTPEEYFSQQRQKHKTRCIKVPAGAGECCAPKLLQYAYLNHLTPVCMAEFWVGPAPRNEMRIDGNYYPACQSKCKPILAHMLQGLNVEENPALQRNRKMLSEVKYLYEDSDIAVVYKPSGLLTAPGKDDVPTLLDVVQQRHPGAMYTHRLDMDTSGIVVFSLNDAAYKNMQDQFYHHAVTKHYIALLDGTLPHSLPDHGTINLPLIRNPFDRPRQVVDYEHGKQAITHYKIIRRDTHQTLIRFTPQTGRTHQLRLHSAHADGLNCPIKGDNLYGKPSDRLYLHAAYIAFRHPGTGEMVEYTCPGFESV